MFNFLLLYRLPIRFLLMMPIMPLLIFLHPFLDPLLRSTLFSQRRLFLVPDEAQVYPLEALNGSALGFGQTYSIKINCESHLQGHYCHSPNKVIKGCDFL